ncbi:AT hook, DNA-binding motif protein [Metarhizium album ARSEF 1941]|uniref:AT hook, DNA-binding motif protein n=1 Tax=Metarhizium album (strain ARSEF 1941) TaxID=1081103 RepID=A0A0B2X002_METAS|nr:AT hook, DNA-binding motif protein [Metarhizium album ARSEF 1941]KHO01842.1 AT hook, DNA-binding motif protein [Metarhizium album ARSEF 1941]
MAPNPERKRGRPPNASTQVKKRGRPRKSDVQPATTRGPTQSSLRESWGSATGRRTTTGEGERPAKRPRASEAARRSSQGAGVIGRRGIPQPSQPGSLGRTGARDDENNDDNEASRPPPPSPEKPYVHVAAHTRRVRQSAIEAKWTPLTNASLTAVSTTLQHAQRPILQRLADSEFRREHTAAAVRQVAQRIARKISRGLPFPPASMPANVGRAPAQSDAGREVELNFESVLDGKLGLERQLEPALDSLDLLRREKDATEQELERDYETLRNLEAGARAQAREQRSLLKKAHPLTPAPSVKPEDGRVDADAKDNLDAFVFGRDPDTAPGGAFTGIRGDDEIHPLAMQLGDHVDSIRGNLEQTEGILPLLASSKATLRAVLLKHLDQRAYEQAVLG